MTAARRLGVAALFAAAFAAQFLLQQPLGRANEVRSARKLHTSPSSLAFRLAAGGVKAAAADALWLSVLPKLGEAWVDPERKAAWIESVTMVMTDANPRAVNPVIYAGYYLEFIRKRHPGIERVVHHALEARERTPFGEYRKVNAGAWQLCEILGMNLYLYGRNPAEKEEAMRWLRRAASDPAAAAILPDFVDAIARKGGSPLEGWSLWLMRAGSVADPGLRRALYAVAGMEPGRGEPLPENPKLRDYYLREADRVRLEVLRRWAAAAEERTGAWPATVEAILAEAPAAERASWEGNPARRAGLVAGLTVQAATRDLWIPSLAEWLDEQGKAEIRLLVRHYELTEGRKPRSFKDLDAFPPPPVAPPARHGTRWELDPATGEPEVLPDLADPRIREAKEAGTFLTK